MDFETLKSMLNVDVPVLDSILKLLSKKGDIHEPKRDVWRLLK